MNMEAIRMPEQDILSAVMRRQIIRHADPYLSLDPKTNPLFRCGEAVQNLVRTYRGEVKTLLSTLSRGKISISDFSAAIDELLGKIKESVGDDISAFSEIEIAVSYIRKHIDVVCTEARGFIASPPGNERDLGWPDAELLRQVEAARAQVASKSAAQQAVICPAAVAPAPAPLSPEPEKRLRVIDNSGDVPLEDHAEYWSLARQFLSEGGKRSISARCHQMAKVFDILSELPLGQGLNRVELQERIGADYSFGNISTLLRNMRVDKGLVLSQHEAPKKPGCYIKVIGRAVRRSQPDASAPRELEKGAPQSSKKIAGCTVGLCNCYALILAVEESKAQQCTGSEVH